MSTSDLFDTADSPVEEARALIALSLVPGVGPGRIRALLRHLGSAQATLAAARRTLERVPTIGQQTAEAIATFDAWPVVDEQIQLAEQVGARLVLMADATYPKALSEIYDPPAFLWLRGEAADLNKPALAIVGTRRATDYGKRVARQFAEALSERGIVIVSGLAHGIDTAAHQAVVEQGGETSAVLGSGVNVIYPSRNTRLAQRLMERGLLISEYPLGAKPDAPNFPRRNRIISGLTQGTLVVEAYESGGALITARLALAQNREVFAVPNGIYSNAAKGTNRLIQAGHAKLVTCVDDIIEEIAVFQQGTSPVLTEAPPLPPLHPIEEKLYAALTTDPVQVDTLCLETGIDTSTALVYLLGLEFKGLVQQMAGKQFCRIS